MPESGRPVIEIFDTTLRDGAQTEGISYSVEDKLRIARRLDELGVAFIEGGWPGSNPKDAGFFERARREKWAQARIVAFGATRRASLKPADDASVRALVEAGTAVCAIFGKSSVLQVQEVLRTTLDENLRMIEETVAYLRAQGKRVIYDAEHFFDGYRADAAYAVQTLQAAVRGGVVLVFVKEKLIVGCTFAGGHGAPRDIPAQVIIRNHLHKPRWDACLLHGIGPVREDVNRSTSRIVIHRIIGAAGRRCPLR